MDAYAFTGDRLPGESWSARHERMLMALPEDGGTLIVITNEVGRSLMGALRYHRGFAVRKRWRYIAARYDNDCAKLEGLRGRIVVDWTFEAHAAAPARAFVRILVDQVAAMQPYSGQGGWGQSLQAAPDEDRSCPHAEIFSWWARSGAHFWWWGSMNGDPQNC